MIINESISKFKKGDKVRVLLPDTLDKYVNGIYDHRASTKEINDAGWKNCTEKNNFSVVIVSWSGKRVPLVTPDNGIKLLKESVTVNESNDEITLKSKDGSEIIINGDGGTYFYTSRGQINKYVAKEVYKALYPKKVIRYVDSSSGFIDFKISSDKIAKMILELPVTSSYKRK